MTQTVIDRLHAAKSPIDKLQAVGLTPPVGGWRSKDYFDIDMAAAKKRHPELTLQQRVDLINAAHDAGLVAEAPRPGEEKQKAAAYVMLLAVGINPPDINYKYTVEEMDSLLAQRNLSPEARLKIKENAFKAGIMASGALEPASVKPAAEKAAKLILARLELDPPKRGEKLNVRAVDRAIKEAGLSQQSVWIKDTLATAGWLA
jgi:hypothetical protein